MVSYAFDDYENWIYPYTYEVYVSQYAKLLSSWKKGVEILDEIKGNELIDQINLYAKVAYLHFEADYLQTQYSYYKRDAKKYKNDVIPLIERAIVATKELMELQVKDSKIGYEASNHYFYTVRTLKERLIDYNELLKYFKNL